MSRGLRPTHFDIHLHGENSFSNKFSVKCTEKTSTNWTKKRSRHKGREGLAVRKKGAWLREASALIPRLCLEHACHRALCTPVPRRLLMVVCVSLQPTRVCREGSCGALAMCTIARDSHHFIYRLKQSPYIKYALRLQMLIKRLSIIEN